jgi:hypothetical protein
MKYSQTFMLAAALVAAGSGVWSTDAQQLFSAQVQTTAVRTNTTGGLSYSHFGNKQIIEQAAVAAGITNPTGLRLVYDKTGDKLEVVMGTNNAVVASPISFADGVSLSRTNGTLVERLSWVFLGTNTMASGTLRATEHLHFGTSNELQNFQLSGQLQFAAPAAGTNAAVVYSGSISAGSFGFEDEGEQDEGHHAQDEGDHGQHGHSD